MAGGVEAERLGCSGGSGADSLFRARVCTPRTADGARAVGQLACCVGRGTRFPARPGGRALGARPRPCARGRGWVTVVQKVPQKPRVLAKDRSRPRWGAGSAAGED